LVSILFSFEGLEPPFAALVNVVDDPGSLVYTFGRFPRAACNLLAPSWNGAASGSLTYRTSPPY
jgi:hypothetical protein